MAKSSYNVPVEAIPDKIPFSSPAFVPPEITTYSGGDNGSSPVRVSTDAIDWLSNQLKTIAEGSHVQEAIDKVAGVQLLPGAFAKAHVLQQKISGQASTEGAGSLKTDTLAFLQGVNEIMAMLAQALTDMSKSYKDTEDDATFTSEELDKLMGDVSSVINSWGESGQASWQDSTPTDSSDGSQQGSGTIPPHKSSSEKLAEIIQTGR